MTSTTYGNGADVGYFERSLPGLLRDTQEQLIDATHRAAEAETLADEARERWLRYEEGIACLVYLSTQMKSELYPLALTELSCYAATGRKPDWVKVALEEMGLS